MLVVPLVAHGTVVGGLLLAGAQARRRAYDAAVLEPLGELAGAYAQAIYNARRGAAVAGAAACFTGPAPRRPRR